MGLGLRNVITSLCLTLRNLSPIIGLKVAQVRFHSMTPVIPGVTNWSSPNGRTFMFLLSSIFSTCPSQRTLCALVSLFQFGISADSLWLKTGHWIMDKQRYLKKTKQFQINILHNYLNYNILYISSHLYQVSEQVTIEKIALQIMPLTASIN